MGIFSSLGASSPVLDWLDQHRNAISQFGVGLASGPTLSRGLALGTQGLAQGAQADTAYATAEKAKADSLAQINKTADFLHSKGFDDLIPLLQAGQGNAALGEAFKRLDPSNALDDKYKQAQIDVLNAKSPMGDAPSGYRWTADGKSLEATPGGPADPSTAQMLSPEALDLVATQYLAGDKSAAVGYARNAALKTQITNAIAAKAKEMGMDGKSVAAEISAYGGNVAAQRSAGTRAAQVGMAASEANQMADIALEASTAVPRGGLVPWNSLVNAVQTGTSSPEMAQFVTATTSLVNAYARAVSPLGAPTDAMRAHAEAMLNTAQGPEAYAAVIAQMKKEMEAALNAPAEISKNLKSQITGPDTPAAGQNYVYNPATGNLDPQ